MTKQEALRKLDHYKQAYSVVGATCLPYEMWRGGGGWHVTYDASKDNRTKEQRTQMNANLVTPPNVNGKPIDEVQKQYKAEPMLEVAEEDAGICPYCHKTMGVNEGSSEMGLDGVCKIQCAYCNKIYQYRTVDKDGG